MKQLSVVMCILALTGCSIFGQQKVRHNKSTSLVEYLYPDGNIPKNQERPVLNLPLRVGLAFIPEQNQRNTISAASKLELLNEVKSTFAQLKYVASIEIIPETYLRNNSNPNHFQQLAQLYQLDVMALVSYDQIVNRKENILALTYLTIVGTYIFPGSHFDVNTLLDLAVIDVNTKRLLFRAAGTHASKGAAAEAYTAHKYDQHQNKHFKVAMQEMTDNLVLEVAEFEQRLKEKRPDDIFVQSKKGYDMAFNSHLLLYFLLIVLIRVLSSKTSNNPSSE